MSIIESDSYPSARMLAGWYERASVRVAPRRRAGDGGGFFYSPKLAPVLNHPMLGYLDEAATNRVLLRYLEAHLRFTIDLEQKIVNPSLISLADASGGLVLGSGMRSDAYHIYCDEAYHALFTSELLVDALALDRAPESRSPSPILSRFSKLMETWGTDREVLHFGFVAVSETLISGTLERLPKDPTVLTYVREVIDDHARDERTHHAYFSKALRVLAPQLSAGEKTALSDLCGAAIRAFLTPDREAVVASLVEVGCERLLAERVVDETHSTPEFESGIDRASRATRKLFSSSMGCQLPTPREPMQ